MKVGFIGAGKVTGTFGRHLLTAGHTIVVSNSRGPETLADFVGDLGPDDRPGDRKDLFWSAVSAGLLTLFPAGFHDLRRRLNRGGL